MTDPDPVNMTQYAFARVAFDHKKMRDDLDALLNSKTIVGLASGFDSLKNNYNGILGEKVNLDSLLYSKRELKLTSDLQKLREDLDRTTNEWAAAKKMGADASAEAAKLREANERYIKLSAVAFIRERVHQVAGDKMIDDEGLVRLFTSQDPIECFVLSVDIRRSTELMLKAREPQRFAAFVVELCSGLRDVIVDNGGVFDKFTGDGILAFFPREFTGADVAGRVLNAAWYCHDVFRRLYAKHEEAFSVVLADVGLGIGIDFGEVTLVRFGNDLSIVGTPVVYACRLGSVQAGKTAVNLTAKEQIGNKYRAECNFVRERIELKHEGAVFADVVSMSAPYPQGLFSPFPWANRGSADADAAEGVNGSGECSTT